jgi:predicted small lipoprotein YifL
MYSESTSGRWPARVAAVLLTVLLGIGLANCGQKGDLYLPRDNEKSSKKR